MMSEPVSSAPRIALIIVNYNTPQDTVQCLESVFQLKHNAHLDIIIVDNGSKDDSVSIIGDYLANKKGTLLPLEENRGYAAGCNAGIRAAGHWLLASGNPQAAIHAVHRSLFTVRPFPAFYWLLNNDTILDPNALRALLTSAKAHPRVKIWGSSIYDLTQGPEEKESVTQRRNERKDKHRLQCAAGFRYLPVLSIPIPIKRSPEKFKGQTCVQDKRLAYISGVSMFVAADVFDKGLMDESYFLYYEELELVRLAGGREHIAWCPDSVVYHKGGAATGGADPNRGRGSYAAHYYGNRSALKYTWKYYKGYFPIVFVFRFIVKSVLFILYGEWRGFKPMVRGYGDFIKL